MPVLLGCIADDFTGGTDLAGMLVKAGMRTVLMIGVPESPPVDDVDAIVIALKSRTSPSEEAIGDSLAALRWLEKAGALQFYFKYCSTFDSTPQGNIGPVTEALMQALGAPFTIACPAFPENGRTIYKGHLFVGDVLLSDSGMRNHPLTPMKDANLVRVLQAQAQGRVGLVDYAVVRQGAEPVRARFDALREEGCTLAIVDAIANDNLLTIGAACEGMALVTGGSGIALGLPQNFHKAGVLAESQSADRLPKASGLRAVLSGSCSEATRAQVDAMRRDHPAFRIDPMALARGDDVAAFALTWARHRIEAGPVLIYATATPDEVRSVQEQIGVAQAGELVEQCLASIAQALVGLGVRQLIVAGGETSGAVVQALQVKGLRIGTEIDPGVPWTAALGGNAEHGELLLALKSGNFGSPDFFIKAWERLES